LPDYNAQPIQYFNPRTSGSHQYFSASQFTEDGLGAIGTANRRFFHGPGLNNWDMALHKMTRLTEGTSIEVRAELFNTFNHAQFENPGGYFGQGNFDSVTAARAPRIGQVAMKLTF
jgi:hypothetical protein